MKRLSLFLFCLSSFLSVSFLKPIFYDAIVIGGGSAGMVAAMELARAKYHVAVISDTIGGQLVGSHNVENIPGIAAKPGAAIMDDLQQQVAAFGVEFMYDTVTAVDFSQAPYAVLTQTYGLLKARAVIIATGSSAKTLAIPGEQAFWGRGVSSCAVCDCFLYQNREVVVIGGGDSAIEEALQLAEYATKVTILVRGAAMRAAEWGKEKLREKKNIFIVYQTDVLEILGDETGVTAVMLHDNATGITKKFATDGVFLAIGHTPNSDLFKKWLPLDAQGYIVLNCRSQGTRVPGVFVAGDVADPLYKKAYIAMGAGGQAGLEAIHYLRFHK